MDVDPRLYGAEEHFEGVPSQPEADAVELALARRVIERDLPVLGVCRRMLSNVALGGTLEQHLPSLDIHAEHRGIFRDHVVLLAADWRIARYYGPRDCGSSPPTIRRSSDSATTSWLAAGRVTTSSWTRSKSHTGGSRLSSSGTSSRKSAPR
jgi:putative glutamine amidotransferase